MNITIKGTLPSGYEYELNYTNTGKLIYQGTGNNTLHFRVPDNTENCYIVRMARSDDSHAFSWSSPLCGKSPDRTGPAGPGMNASPGDQGLDLYLWESNPKLMAYLPFEENTSTGTDDWGAIGADGSITGAAWGIGMAGNGNALDFEGSDDRVDIDFGSGYNVGTDDLTVMLWARPDATSNSEMVFSFGTSTDNRRAYAGTTGGAWDIGIRSSGWGSGLTSVNALWNHIAVVWDSQANTATLYINGTYSMQKTFTDYSLLADLKIGVYGDHTYDFNGLIDEVRVYNASLTQKEIIDAMQSGRTRHRIYRAVNETGGAIAKVSESSCSDLGWTNAATYGSPEVCGESDDAPLGACSGTVTFSEALAFCQDAGARLCTYEEIDDDEPRGTGCSYDTERIWSSTPCAKGSHYTQAGASTSKASVPKQCIADSTAIYARCCADNVPYIDDDNYTDTEANDLAAPLRPSLSATAFNSSQINVTWTDPLDQGTGYIYFGESFDAGGNRRSVLRDGGFENGTGTDADQWTGEDTSGTARAYRIFHDGGWKANVSKSGPLEAGENLTLSVDYQSQRMGFASDWTLNQKAKKFMLMFDYECKEDTTMFFFVRDDSRACCEDSLEATHVGCAAGENGTYSKIFTTLDLDTMDNSLRLGVSNGSSGTWPMEVLYDDVRVYEVSNGTRTSGFNQLRIQTNSTGSWTDLKNDTASPYINTTLEPVTQYCYRAYSADLSGNENSTASDIVCDVTPAPVITSCAELTIPHTTYTLTENVSADRTCINVLANNITLDCDGYYINYSSTGTGYGINVTGVNFTTIRNCNVRQTAGIYTYSYAVYLEEANNASIDNNSLQTKPNGVNSVYNTAIYLTESSQNNITNNYIETAGRYSYGIDLESNSDRNSIANNTVYTILYNGRPINVVNSDWNVILNNTLTAASYSSEPLYLQSSSFCTIVNNTLDVVSSIGLFVNGGTTKNYYNHTLLNNTNEGKDLLYYFNIQNRTFRDHDNVGQLWITESINVTIINFSMDQQGIYMFNADDSSIKNSTVSTNPSGQRTAAHIFSSDRITITGSHFQMTSWAYPLYMQSSNYAYVYNNTLRSTSSNAPQAYLVSSNHGIYARNEHIGAHATLSNGIFTYNSDNNTFYDSYISTPSEDIYARGTGANTLVNVSFEKTDVLFYTGTTGGFNISYYFDASVYDTPGTPIENALVTATDDLAQNVLSELTDSQGKTPRKILREFYVYDGGRTEYNNYTILASHADYNPGTESINITRNYNVTLNLTGGPVCLDLATPHEVYRLTTDVEGDTNCFNIMADNVTLDCAGYSITGKQNGFGINMTNKQNVMVRNCVITNFSRAINVNGTNNSRFINNTILRNYGNYSGMYLNNSNWNNITNMTFFGNNASHNPGLYLWNSTYNRIINTTMTSNNMSFQKYNSRVGGIIFGLRESESNTIENLRIMKTIIRLGIAISERIHGGGAVGLYKSSNNRFTSTEIIGLNGSNGVFNNGGWAFGIENSNNVTVSSLRIDSMNLSLWAGSGTYFKGNGTKLEKVNITNIRCSGGLPYGCAIFVIASWNNSLRDIRIENASIRGSTSSLPQGTVWLYSFHTSNLTDTIIRNVQDSSSAGGLYPGVKITDSYGSMLKNITIINISLAMSNRQGGIGLDIYNTDNSTFTNLTFINLSFSGTARTGAISINESENNLISTIRSYGPVRNQILLTSNLAGSRGNNVSNAYLWNATEEAIFISHHSTKNNTFKNVVINSTRKVAINITHTGLTRLENVTITGAPWSYSLWNASDIEYDFRNDSVFFGNQYGSIRFTNKTITASGVNLSKILNITSGKAQVRSDLDPGFNISANITINNVVADNPKIRVDYEDDGTYEECVAPQCYTINAGSNYVFNVSHFTTYTVQDAGILVGCGDLDIAHNVYTLVADASSTFGCFNIKADNVTLDCAGYSITGKQNGFGINMTNKQNVTVKNCVITNFSRGINVNGTNNSRFINNTLIGNQKGTYSGMYLMDAHRNNITDSRITKNNATKNSGISLYQSNDTLIKDITIQNTTAIILSFYGGGIIGADHSHRTTITNISFSGCNVTAGISYGGGFIGLYRSNSSTVQNITVTRSRSIMQSLILGSPYIGDSVSSDNSFTDLTFLNNYLSVGSFLFGGGLAGSSTGSNQSYSKIRAYNNIGVEGTTVGGGAVGARGTTGLRIQDVIMANNSLTGNKFAAVGLSAVTTASISNVRVLNASSTIQYSILILSSGNISLRDVLINESPMGVWMDINRRNITLINVTILDSVYGLVISRDPSDPPGSNGINLTNVTINVSSAVGTYILGARIVNLDNVVVYDSPAHFMLENASIGTYDFRNASISWVSDFGNITFINRTITASGANLSKVINITVRKAQVRTDLDEGFNTSANITLYQTPSLSTPKVQVDYEDDGTYVMCLPPQCYNLSYEDETFVFNVSHFTSYRGLNNTPPGPPILTMPVVMNTSHYSDSGNAALDPWLSIGKRTSVWGAGQNFSVAWNESHVNYSFTGLNSSRLYQARIIYYRGSANAVQTLSAEGISLHGDVAVNSSGASRLIELPAVAYDDGDLNMTFSLVSGPNVTVAAVWLIEYDTVLNVTPTFQWINASDGEGDSLYYHIQVCEEETCTVKPIDDSNVSSGYVNTTEELVPGNMYWWRVRASDRLEWGNWSALANFTLDYTVSIILLNDTVDFGTADPGDILDSTTNDPTPFVIENDGNSNVNISMITNSLWVNQPLGTHYFQAKARESNETHSFDLAGSNTSWFNLTSTYTDMISRLNYTDSNDTCYVDLKVEVPLMEPDGQKTADITFRAEQTI